jgi:hypothetical protein
LVAAEPSFKRRAAPELSGSNGGPLRPLRLQPVDSVGRPQPPFDVDLDGDGRWPFNNRRVVCRLAC